MMPIKPQPKPTANDLLVCLATSSSGASRRNIAGRWKAFRMSPCGAAWFNALTAAYGHRCVYCDHAPGRTIDHISSKSRNAKTAFAWANWLPACMACNHGKGTSRLVICPTRLDPLEYLTFDITTGEPSARVGLSTAKSRRAAESIRKLALDHETLSEARRARRQDFVRRLSAFAKGRLSKRKLLRALRTNGPHRALMRELLIESDPILNPYLTIASAAMARAPELMAWARQPN